MPRAVSSKRYAQAVFQIALEQGDLDTWQNDLEVMGKALENPEFAGLLDAPQMPTAVKIAVTKETLAESVTPLSLNLISLLASRGVSHFIPRILDEYVMMLDSHKGIERAEVVTAFPLNKRQETQIVKLLENSIGKKIEIRSTQQPRIIGGLIARVGDRVIDGSVVTKLKNLRRELVENF